MPPLILENKDALKVYNLTEGQVIVASMGGIIDIQQSAIWEVIDRYQIENSIKVFEKVVSTFRYFLNIDKEKEEEEKEEAKTNEAR